MRINSNDPPAYSKLNRNNSVKSDSEEKSNKEDKLSINEVPIKDSVRIRPAIKLDESEFTSMSFETKDSGYVKKLLESTKNDILSNATAAISAQANQKPDSLVRLLK